MFSRMTAVGNPKFLTHPFWSRVPEPQPMDPNFAREPQSMMPAFEFATANRIVFGAGTVKQAGSLAAQFGRRAFLITGRDQSRAGSLVNTLSASGIQSCLFSVAGEPELSTVQRGAREAKTHACDLVI